MGGVHIENTNLVQIQDQLSITYVLSRFCHIFHKDEYIALYNSLTMCITYCNQDILPYLLMFNDGSRVSDVLNCASDNDKNEVCRFLRDLISSEYLVPNDYDELSKLVELKKAFSQPPTFNEIFLFPTDKCNFACSYCHVMNGMSNDYSQSDMDRTTARKIIDLFIQTNVNSKEQLNVVFYGGEPLLNFTIIEYAILYTVNECKRLGLRNELQFNLFTNLSLITKQMADFFHQYNVMVIGSIDGPKAIHDCMRHYRSGAPTFDDVLRGYHVAKEAGCSVGISCTVGIHNIDVLPEIVEYFAKDLDPITIGLNTQHLIRGSANPAVVCLEENNRKIIESFKVARKYGLYEVKSINRTKVIAEKKARVRDCACGNQFIVSPDGKIGLCQLLISNRDFYFDPECFTEPLCCSVFSDWYNRHPLNMPECYSCAALLICGGGCKYESLLRYGTIWKHDDRVCVQSKRFLEFLLWDLHDLICHGKKDQQERFSFYKPTDQDRLKLYGKIQVGTRSYPMENYHDKMHSCIT